MKAEILFTTIICILIFSANIKAQKTETIIQKGHSGAVKVIAVSPDSKYLFTGSRDRTVKLWEISSGRELRTYKGMSKTVHALAVSPNSEFVAASGNDFDLFIWEVKTGKLIKTIKAHKERVTSLAFHPTEPILVSAGLDWYAKIWNFKTGELISKFKVSPDKGLGLGIDLKFTPDGNQLVLGADNRRASLVNFKTGKTIRKYEGVPEGMCGGCGTCIDVSKNGKYILSAGHRGPLILWNLSSGKKEKVFIEEKKYFTSAVIDPNSKKVVVTDKDTLFVWNVSNGKLLFKRFAHKKDINDGAMSPNGKYYFTASDDHKVIMWNMNSGRQIRTFEGYLKNPEQSGAEWDEESYWQRFMARYYAYKTLIKLSPDGKYFIKGKIDSIARLYELESGRKVYDLQGHSKSVVCFDFSPDGKYIATGSTDKTIKIWDFKTGKLIRTLKGHKEIIFSVEFSKNSKELLSASKDGSARIWDIESGEELKYINMRQRSPYLASYTPNQLYVVTSGLDKTLEIWEKDAVTSFRKYVGHTDVVSSIEFSPDETKMLTTSWDGKTKMWDIPSGYQIKRFFGDQSYVHSAKFSSDGKYIFTAGAKGNIIMWNVTDGTEVKRFESHPNMVTSIDITPDDAVLISCDIEGMIKIWNVITGKEILSYILMGKDDYLVKTPKGFFDGTQKGKQSVIFVKGMESFGLDQFFEDFYRPDLYKEAYNSLGNIQGMNLDRKLKMSPPPGTKILSPQDYYMSETAKVVLEFEVEDAGGGIDEIKILHNGKRISERFKLPHTRKIGKLKKFSLEMNLVKGENEIKVSAFSKGRIESSFSKITVMYNADESLPNCYILSVGINEYENSVLNLNYARSDAKAVTKILKRNSRKLFNNIIVYQLIDYDAGKDSIMSSLKDISTKAKSEDVFVFYYAGHGAMILQDFYFIPHDCVRVFDEETLKIDALFAGDVQELFKKISALKQLVIMDACQSGGATEILAQRGAVEEKAIAQMSRSAGIHVLASAGSEQFASEYKDLKHGLFTYILLEALGGKADGSPNDGKVTIYEMKSYIDNLVPELTLKYRGSSQYPYTFSKGNDFPVCLD